MPKAEMEQAVWYLRKKGRDLFDLAVALDKGQADPARIVGAFSAYMDHGGHHVTRAVFEQNLAGKLCARQFTADIGPLLAAGYKWDMESAAFARQKGDEPRGYRLPVEGVTPSVNDSVLRLNSNRREAGPTAQLLL